MAFATDGWLLQGVIALVIETLTICHSYQVKIELPLKDIKIFLRKEQKVLNLKANVCSKHWLFVVLCLVNSIVTANFSTDNEMK
jgi:hypothetical protein